MQKATFFPFSSLSVTLPLCLFTLLPCNIYFTQHTMCHLRNNLSLNQPFQSTPTHPFPVSPTHVFFQMFASRERAINVDQSLYIDLASFQRVYSRVSGSKRGRERGSEWFLRKLALPHCCSRSSGRLRQSPLNWP